MRALYPLGRPVQCTVKDPWTSAVLGTLLFLAVNASGLILIPLLERRAMEPAAAITVLIFLATVLGAPALLVALVLARRLQKGLDRGWGRGKTLLLGTLYASPLSLPIAIPLVLVNGDTHLEPTDVVLLLATALTGAVSLGLGCAWWVSRPLPE
ncbi:MAG TPA: hypothetical protein VF950_03630 [Planctomycetota bacterium]